MPDIFDEIAQDNAGGGDIFDEIAPDTFGDIDPFSPDSKNLRRVMENFPNERAQREWDKPTISREEHVKRSTWRELGAGDKLAADLTLSGPETGFKSGVAGLFKGLRILEEHANPTMPQAMAEDFRRIRSAAKENRTLTPADMTTPAEAAQMEAEWRQLQSSVTPEQLQADQDNRTLPGRIARRIEATIPESPQPSNVSRPIAAVGNAAGSLASSMMFAPLGPAGVTEVMFLMELSDAYDSEMARQQDVGEPLNPDKAFLKANLYAPGSAALEYIGGAGRLARRWFGLAAEQEVKELARRGGPAAVLHFFKARATDAAAEGGTEALQRLYQDAIVMGKPNLAAALIEGGSAAGGSLLLGGLSMGARLGGLKADQAFVEARQNQAAQDAITQSGQAAALMQSLPMEGTGEARVMNRAADESFAQPAQSPVRDIFDEVASESQAPQTVPAASDTSVGHKATSTTAAATPAGGEASASLKVGDRIMAVDRDDEGFADAHQPRVAEQLATLPVGTQIVHRFTGNVYEKDTSGEWWHKPDVQIPGNSNIDDGQGSAGGLARAKIIRLGGAPVTQAVGQPVVQQKHPVAPPTQAERVRAELMQLPGADQDLAQQPQQPAAQPYTTEQALADLGSVIADIKAKLEQNQIAPQAPAGQSLPQPNAPQTGILETPGGPGENTLAPALETQPQTPAPPALSTPAKPVTPPVKRKSPFVVRPRPDGVPDILDAIQEAGGMAPLDSAVYGNWRDAFTGPARMLIRKGGRAADKLVDDLSGRHAREGEQAQQAQTFHVEKVDDIIEAVRQAVAVREKLRDTGGGEDAQAERFWTAISKQPTQTGGLVRISADQLQPGDKFRLRGPGHSHEELEVRSVANGVVTLKDGKAFGWQEVPEGTEFWAQKKGLELAAAPEQSGGTDDKSAGNAGVSKGNTAAGPQPGDTGDAGADRARGRLERDARAITGDSGLSIVRIAPGAIADQLRSGRTGAGGVEAIAKLFRTRVVWFRQTGTTNSTKRINGWTDTTGKFVFLNVATPQPHLAILGHELIHTLSARNPALYAELIQALRPLYRNLPEYDALKRKIGYQGSLEAIEEEFIADFAASQFNTPAFWERLHDQNPSVFKRTLNRLLSYLDKLIGQLTGKQYQAEQWFSDVTAAREVLAGALAQYAAGNNGSNPAAAQAEAGLIRGSAAEKWADEVIANGKQRLHAGLDPELLVAYVVKGTAILESGIRDVAEWSKAMVSQFGEAIRPHLQNIFNQATSTRWQAAKTTVTEQARQALRGVPPDFSAIIETGRGNGWNHRANMSNNASNALSAGLMMEKDFKDWLATHIGVPKKAITAKALSWANSDAGNYYIEYHHVGSRVVDFYSPGAISGSPKFFTGLAKGMPNRRHKAKAKAAALLAFQSLRETMIAEGDLGNWTTAKQTETLPFWKRKHPPLPMEWLKKVNEGLPFDRAKQLYQEELAAGQAAAREQAGRDKAEAEQNLPQLIAAAKDQLLSAQPWRANHFDRMKLGALVTALREANLVEQSVELARVLNLVRDSRRYLRNFPNANAPVSGGAAGIKTPLETQSQRAEAQADKSNIAAWQPEEGSALTGEDPTKTSLAEQSGSLRNGQSVSDGGRFSMDDLFGAPESVAEQKERLKAEAEAAKLKKAKETMRERAGARLTGKDLDTTKEMFGAEVKQDKAGQGSLFSLDEDGRRTFTAGNATVTAPGLFSIDAHHGTPHKVDKFSTAKIGTGEGAQVYGWGLYFAENPAVARDYASKLGSRGEYRVDGKPMQANPADPMREALSLVSAYGWDGAKDEITKRIGRVYAMIESGREVADTLRYVGDVNRQVDQLKGKRVEPPAGNTYTVRLNVEPEDLLDWDKPLSQQSEKVRAILTEHDQSPLTAAAMRLVYPEKDGRYAVDYHGATIGRFATYLEAKQAAIKFLTKGGMTGQMLYSYSKGEAENVSKALLASGIRGIRYLDQGSRQTVIPVKTFGGWTWNGRTFNTEAEAKAFGESSATYNYVIFSDEDITITHENGQPVSAGALFSMDQEETNPEPEAKEANRKRLIDEIEESFRFKGSNILDADFILPDGRLLLIDDPKYGGAYHQVIADKYGYSSEYSTGVSEITSDLQAVRFAWRGEDSFYNQSAELRISWPGGLTTYQAAALRRLLKAASEQAERFTVRIEHDKFTGRRKDFVRGQERVLDTPSPEAVLSFMQAQPNTNNPLFGQLDYNPYAAGGPLSIYESERPMPPGTPERTEPGDDNDIPFSMDQDDFDFRTMTAAELTAAGYHPTFDQGGRLIQLIDSNGNEVALDGKPAKKGGQADFDSLQEQITAAEAALKKAIRQHMNPPQGMRKAEALEAKNAAASTLHRLMARQLKQMTSAQVDAARSPEQTAELIGQTVHLLNSIQDEISERTARSQEVLADLTKLRQDLQTRLNLLKGWADDQTDEAAQGIKPTSNKPETLVSRIRYMEIEGATNPSKLSFPYWHERFKKGIKKFLSPIPELPLFGDRARFTSLFKRGYRLFAVENNRVKKEAAEKVKNVLEPLAKLNRTPADNDALQRYYRLAEKLSNARKAGDETRVTALAEQLHALETTVLNKDPFNLFRRLVLYRDFYWRGTYLKNDEGKPIALPGGLTPDEVLVQLRRITKAITEHPDGLAITEALRRHYALMEELRQSILAHGEIIPEALNNPTYFPHLLTEYYSDNLGRVNPTTEESFRKYLITPVGSERLIQTDYIKAVLQHTAEVLSHNARADLVEKYWQSYDISEQLKEQHGDKWDRAFNLPPGYSLYAPYKKLPLRSTYILSRDVLAKQLGVLFNDGDLRERMAGKVVKVKPEDLRTAMVAGEKIKWALPTEIVDALHGIEKREAALANQPDHAGAAAGKVVRRMMNYWKQLKLFGPTAFARYSFGNLTTDAIDKVLVADPKTAGYMRRAARELWRADQGEQTPEFKAASREGVFETITAGEVGKLEKLPEFREFMTTGQVRKAKADKVAGAPAALNSFRESTFRYAKFLADVERLRAGEEIPFTGMYHKDIDALGALPNGKKAVLEGEELIYAKAAENSLRHFGDYNMLAVNTQWLRRYIMPFVSWTDVNLRYHVSLAANMVDAFRPGATELHRTHALRVSGAKIAMALAFVGVAKELWNQFGGPLLGLWDDEDDLENKLSPHDRRRAHIILGKDAKGEVMVMYTPSAFGDVAEWVGGQNFKRLFFEYARGDITLDQWISDYAKQLPVDFGNKLVQSTGPVIKGPYELASDKATFPDIFDQRTIPKSDKWWRFVGTMTDDRIANWVRGVFDEDYYNQPMADQLQQIVLQVRRRDPQSWAYYEIKEQAAEWEFAKTGKRFSQGDYTAPEAMALRNFRRAIYRGDVAAADQFYHSLLRYGYTAERLDASIRNQAPLAGLNLAQQKEFKASMDARTQQQLALAEQYYAKLKALDGREKQLFPKAGKKAEPNPQLLRRVVEEQRR